MLLISKYYFQEKNILISFKQDNLDQSKLLLKCLKERPNDSSIEILDICDHLIIVPHEIDIKLINQIEQKFSNHSSIKFSEINNNINAKIIIIDKIGILPELYKYTKIAYVGGGFGKGVHSTIEPLVYNNIVCYGPNIDLLDEAKQMHEKQFGFIIENNNYFVNNLDINLICERPKVSKYRNKIISSLSGLMNINKNIINLKGKTVEKLGILGKEKAIACEAIISISKYE